MLLAVSAIIVGFIILVWGADRFIMGAAALARNLGVAPLLIGLTIVGLGTSAPEILVSAMASFQGNPSLAIGNAIGSNIANIGLILGVTALVAPLMVHSDVLRREYPLLMVISIAVFILLIDGELSRLDGVVMLGGLVATLVYVIRIGKSRASCDPSCDPLEEEFEAEIRSDLSTFAASMWFIAGLALLLLSSRMLVWGAVQVAQAFGVSDLVIGLTIVAIGTSLPELAASVMSALKNEHDIALGNIIGSNIYNMLAVLCVPGLVSPTLVDSDVLTRDMPLMLILTAALYVMGRSKESDGNGHIHRFEGFILLACFIGYQGWLLTQAVTA